MKAGDKVFFVQGCSVRGCTLDRKLPGADSWAMKAADDFTLYGSSDNLFSSAVPAWEKAIEDATHALYYAENKLEEAQAEQAAIRWSASLQDWNKRNPTKE